MGSLDPGGAERQWANIAIGLKARGYSPIIVIENGLNFASTWILDDLKEYEIQIIIIADNYKKSNKLLNWKYRKKFRTPIFQSIYQEICRNIDEDKYFTTICEIIRIHRPYGIVSALDDVNINFALAGLLYETQKIIISFRSVSPENYKDVGVIPNYRYKIYKYIYFRDDVISTTNSEHGGKSYREYFKDSGQENRIILLKNSFLLTEISINKMLPNGQTSCCAKNHIYGAMRFSPEKSPSTWLDVIEYLHIENKYFYHFVLFGNGIEMREIIGRIHFLRRRGINVDYGGQSDFIFKIFLNKGVLLSTSVFEGESNLENEAKNFKYGFVKVFDQSNIGIGSQNKKLYVSNHLTSSLMSDISSEIRMSLRGNKIDKIYLQKFNVKKSESLIRQIDSILKLLDL